MVANTSSIRLDHDALKRLEILRAFKRGEGIAAIARRFGVSSLTIHRILRERRS